MGISKNANPTINKSIHLFYLVQRIFKLSSIICELKANYEVNLYHFTDKYMFLHNVNSYVHKEDKEGKVQNVIYKNSVSATRKSMLY